MGYTIVYQRLFLRADDRYIPFCLAGSNNCTMFSPLSGREVRERSWGTFLYDERMLLATEAEIMQCLEPFKNSSEEFQFRSKWISGSQLPAFFANGIKTAVTVEELREQAGKKLCCSVDRYFKRKPGELGTLRYQSGKRMFPETSAELAAWVEKARSEKQALMNDPETDSVFISIRLLTSMKINVLPTKLINEPCVAKAASGYIVDVSASMVRYNKDASMAKVFQNSGEAYREARLFRGIGAVDVVAVSAIKKKEEKPKDFALSVERSNVRVYVRRLTAHTLHYSYGTGDAKRFASEKDAMRWYEKHIDGRFDTVKNPRAVRVKE